MKIAIRLCFCSLLLLAVPFAARAQITCGPPININFGIVNSVPDSETFGSGNCTDNTYNGGYYTGGGPFQVTVSPSTVGPYSAFHITVTFDPSTTGTYTGGGSYYLTSTSGVSPIRIDIGASAQYLLPGFVNPKYVIMGVWYDPPGSQSQVCYGSDTVVGNSSTVMSSFSDSVTKSVSGTSGSLWSTTNTQSTTYTQEQDSSTTVAVNQTTSNNHCLGAFQGFTFYGLDHDWDHVFVWLNPIANFDIDPNSGAIVWTGYSWDQSDPTYPDLDVFGIPVGCLNGDFQTSNPAEWSTCQSYFQCPSGPLARCWALNNTDGSGPGLTGFGTPCNPQPNPMTDLCTILAADQFGSSNFTFTPPTSPNLSTPDGRFTACDATHSHCNTVIQYSPGNGNQYSEGYTATTTQSQGYKNTYSTAYSVENKFQGTSWLSGFNLDLKTSNTLTWVNGFSTSTNTSNGQTSALTIVAPPPGYTGPSEFVLYQDNLYGTFMLNPQ
jgi:hypothetical protein